MPEVRLYKVSYFHSHKGASAMAVELVDAYDARDAVFQTELKYRDPYVHDPYFHVVLVAPAQPKEPSK